MKKILLFVLVAVVTAFQFCSSSKKAASAETSKITYAHNIQPLIQTNCTPCHIPPQGRAKALNSYDAVKSHADEIITRIKKDPSEKGFMPAKHPKLSDSTISIFEKWKESGLAE
ncbi:MAG TPA: cytochrome c [Flavisolibacter sp.]|nr:cytochrome c [Flavisolibacter sp.]